MFFKGVETRKAKYWRHLQRIAFFNQAPLSLCSFICEPFPREKDTICISKKCNFSLAIRLPIYANNTSVLEIGTKYKTAPESTFNFGVNISAVFQEMVARKPI